MSAEFEAKVLEKFDKMEKHSAEFEETVLAKFDEIDKKFEGIDNRFDEIDKRFEEIDNRFDKFDKKFEGKFDQLDKKIEGKTDMIMNYLFEMSQTMKGMDKRLKTVESTVKRAGTIMVHSATCGSPQDAL